MAAVENTNGLSLGTGIEYSWTVQQLGESSEVPNNKYFYDFGTKLVYYKDINGVIINIFDQSRVHYSEASATINSRTNYLIKRTVVTGLKATFEILITTDGKATMSVNNVIPLNFLGKKYFKLNRYTHIIKRLTKHTDTALMTGTYSTVNGDPSATPPTMATVVGVGTQFLSEFSIGDRITSVASGGNTSGSGYIASIQSDTQMTLHQTSVTQAASGDPVYNMFGVGIEGFTRVDFNDLLNTYSTDLNNTTGFGIIGRFPGQLSQFEGSLGMTSEMPINDASLLNDTNGMEYSTGYSPKDFSLAPLNMTYNPKENANGTAVNPVASWLPGAANPGGTSDGEFHIVLEGYLL